MKVLLVNGSPHKQGETYHALSLVEKALHEKGMATEWFWVGNKPVRGCIDCGQCGKNFRCAFSDDVCNDLIEAILKADGVIVESPVYFAAPSGALCALLDRVFYAASTHGVLFKGKPAAAVASCIRSGANSTVERIMQVPLYAEGPGTVCAGPGWSGGASGRRAAAGRILPAAAGGSDRPRAHSHGRVQ